MINVIKQEIERTSERTKVGLVGIIKTGHISHKVDTLSKNIDNKNKGLKG